jgi:hypothetical protein
MGWASRLNLNSQRKRAEQSVRENASKEVQAQTPSNGEPVVMVELTLRNIWEILCRRFSQTRPRPLQDHAPTS